jgi:membrane protease YdiL (CAAX protease family)
MRLRLLRIGETTEARSAARVVARACAKTDGKEMTLPDIGRARATLSVRRGDWPIDSWNIWLSILNAVGALIIGLVPAIVYLIVLAALGQFDPSTSLSTNVSLLLVSQTLTYFPTAIFLAFTLPLLARVPLKDLGLRRPTRRALLIAAGGAIVMVLVVDAVANILAHFGPKSIETSVALLQELRTPGDKVSYILISIVLAPMVEELCFRVYLFNALSKYMTVAAAAVVSGICFGLIHVIGSPPQQLVTVAIPLALGGIILATVYATSRNYWASVLTHGLFNAVSTFSILFVHAT